MFDKPVPVGAMSSINFVLLFWFQFVTYFAAALESNFFWDVLNCIEIMTVKRLPTEVLITGSRIESEKNVLHTLAQYQAFLKIKAIAVISHLL